MLCGSDERRILGFFLEYTGIEKIAQGSIAAKSLAGAGLGAFTGAYSAADYDEMVPRALWGGALGAAGGVGLHAMTPAGARDISDAIAKQIYGLTGRLPGQERMPAETVRSEMERLGLGKPGVKTLIRRGQLARAELASQGADYLSGWLSRLVASPGQTLRLGLRSITPVRAVMLGAGLLPVAKSIVDRDKPTESADTRQTAKRIGRLVGLTAAGPLPLVPAMVLSTAGTQLGGLVGSAMER